MCWAGQKVAPGKPAASTPSAPVRPGRLGLLRVPEGAITDLSQYDYWDGTTWVRDNPAVAAPVLGDSPIRPDCSAASSTWPTT